MIRRCLATALAAGAVSLLAASDAALTARPFETRSTGPAGAKRFQRLDPAASGVTVPNVFNDPRMWGDRFREYTLGALETGVAVADFNGDGRLDVYALSKNGACALYLQEADGRFTDRAEAAGVSCAGDPAGKTGTTAVDINQDGRPDLYVCRLDAPNLLFVNNGDGTFTERAAEYGLDLRDASVHAVFADYDRDGDLDAYLVTNILDFAKSPQGRRDYLLRNDGAKFTDVSKTAGIWGLTQGHTAIWFDANDDGWPDLYVANDFETPDRFYLNKGDGTFVDVVDQRLPHVTYFSMGADSGDVNNDGRVDFFVADMRDRTHAAFMAGMEEIGRGLWENERVPDLIPQYMWNALYLNTGRDRYLEAAHLAGITATGWTWAPRLVDLDNDGRLDAFFTGGMLRNFVDADIVDRQNVAPTLAARALVWKNAPRRDESTLAFRNAGDLRFENVSADWGLDEVGISFGCAIADLEGDGDLDLVYARCDAPPAVVRNHTATGHRIAVHLAGRAPNRDAIGAEVRIETASGVQVRQLYGERGIVSSEPAVAFFGLGDDPVVRRLTVRWPRGQVQTFENLAADQRYTLTEPAPDGTPLPPAILRTPPAPATLLTEAGAARGLKAMAQQRPFDEFVKQRLLPRRLNAQGPALAAADVDGDGRTDLFVSGTPGQSGVLHLAQADGTFRPAPEQPWSTAAEANDTGAVFTDVDGDGRADLVIVSGGVERPAGDPLLNDRVYLNRGGGVFAPADGALPADGESTKAVAAADFDGDGAADLFVGGRSVPAKYPAVPRSFLYRNEGGRLVDVTDELAPGLRQAGLVTAAAWADLDGDRRPDLLVATEWGPVAWWRNTGRGFENRTAAAGLAAHTGWWSALAVLDADGDGRPDIVAGNVGLNTKYHATAAEPTVLLAGDFDGNGRPQLVEAQYEDGQLRPVRGRSKLAYVFPWLARKFPSYRAYGEATIEEIFGAERLARVQRLEANTLASGVFRNRGDGTFEFRELPRAAQLAPINAIAATDLDGDGRPDLVCVGNNFGPEPNTGRFDGGLGVVLLNGPGGAWRAVPTAESGLLVPGDARSAVVLPGADGNGPAIVVTQTNGAVFVFAARAAGK